MRPDVYRLPVPTRDGPPLCPKPDGRKDRYAKLCSPQQGGTTSDMELIYAFLTGLHYYKLCHDRKVIKLSKQTWGITTYMRVCAES